MRELFLFQPAQKSPFGARKRGINHSVEDTTRLRSPSTEPRDLQPPARLADIGAVSVGRPEVLNKQGSCWFSLMYAIKKIV